MTLTLSDGTVFHNSHAIENGTNLHIYVQDGQSDIRDVFEAFIDSEKHRRSLFRALETRQPSFAAITSSLPSGTKAGASLRQFSP